MGRVRQAGKNIFFGYISNIAIMVMGFLQRTAFIMVLGRTLLGVNGLYTEILGMLSLADLGIASALNYSLYKPVAEHDREKIKSYMQFYKKAYRAIAGEVALIGLALAPFLPYIIKEHEGVTAEELTVYYLIFLFNTVSTYLVAYKYSLSNAQQHDYVQTNIATITKIATVLAQIIILFATKNFLLFLLTQAAVELVQKIFVSIYFNKRYPYLKDRDVRKLSKEETGVIATKTKALMFHKLGDVARTSTDSIIITYFMNVDWVGIVTNYTMVISYASNFINVIFNSVVSGLGNLVATEPRQKQYTVFRVYRFFACWLYGFAAAGFWLLLTPFITQIWLNESWKMEQAVLTLILMDFYFRGSRVVLMNFKIATGLFEQDKYLSLLKGVINLVVSIVGIKYLGLAGVYVGTVLSGIIVNLVQPVILYRECFSCSAWAYFKDSVKYIGTIVGIILLLVPIRSCVMGTGGLPAFILMVLLITAVYNMVFFLLFRRTEEFGYLWMIAESRLPFLRKLYHVD